MLTMIILIADAIMYMKGRDTGLYILGTITVFLDFILFALLLGAT